MIFKGPFQPLLFYDSIRLLFCIAVFLRPQIALLCP